MEERHVQVAGGSLRYTDVGSGRPVVVVQGVWVSRDLWNDVVAGMVLDLVERLEPEDVVLVGNDTGGGQPNVPHPSSAYGS